MSANKSEEAPSDGSKVSDNQMQREKVDDMVVEADDCNEMKGNKI